MSLSSNENDDEDGVMNVSLLISEIKKRPGLYDQSTPEFSNKEGKTKLWCDVTKAVYPAWTDWEFKKKRDKVREVQNKWRMLKEMFLKRRDSRRSLTASGKKKKKYRYFDKMGFLLPFMNVENVNNNDSACTSTNVRSQPSQEQSNRPSTSSANQDDNIQNNNMAIPSALPGRSDAEENSVAIPDSLQLDQDLPNPEIDENTHFFLMLVPMMRKLTDEQRYFARKYILRIMRQASWLGDIPPEEDDDLPLQGMPFSAVQPNELQGNEINLPNVVGSHELEPGLGDGVPPIAERSADQVQAYQVQPGPSCSSQPPAQPPLNPNPGRITILQNELRYPESTTPELDV